MRISYEQIVELFDQYGIWNLDGMPSKEMMKWPRARYQIKFWVIELSWVWDYWVYSSKEIKIKDILDTIEFYKLCNTNICNKQ